jgi:ABC-type dipeptide/oligopeptide/nickel transport system permease component
MAKFVIRRILITIPVILIVILLTYGLMRAIPGNPFRKTERNVPESIQKNLEKKFHLDEPWWKQYGYYVKGVFTWDLGPSMSLRTRTVTDIVEEQFPRSIKLGVIALLWGIVIGVPAGIISALRQNSVLDYSAQVVANVGAAIPNFLVATLLIYGVALKAGWLPTNGWPTGTWELDNRIILPTFALGLVPMTYLARLTRATMLETLQQDYVRTARAKGLRWRRVVLLHVFRNSLIPVVTVLGPLLGYLITGSFIIETIFSIPGIGKYYITAVSARDLSVVMGLTVILSLIVIVANMIVDILYGFLDPRTREARA